MWYLDVVMIFEAVLYMTEKLEYIQPVDTCVQQGIHTFKRGFPKIESIIHFMLEWAHLNFTYLFRNHIYRITLWVFQKQSTKIITN